MKNLAFTAPDYKDVGTCAQSLGNHVAGFRNCGRTARVKGAIVGDNRVLSFCGTHAKAPNVTILETLGSPKPKRTAVLAVKLCCANGHQRGEEQGPIPAESIIPNVMASISYCDERAAQCMPGCVCNYGKRYAAAADKLRDFATVELLCEGLGITRKELN